MTFNISNFAKQVITLLPDEEKSCQEAVDLISEATTDDNIDEIATKIFEQIGNEKGLSKIALIFSLTSPEPLNSPLLTKIKNACLERLIPNYQKKSSTAKIEIAIEKKEMAALTILLLQDGQGSQVVRNFKRLGLKDLPDNKRLELCELIALQGEGKALANNLEELDFLRLSANQRLKLCTSIASHGGGKSLVDNLRQLGLKKLPADKRFKLCELIVSHGGANTLACHFAVSEERQCIPIANYFKIYELIASNGGGRSLLYFEMGLGLKYLSVAERLKLAELIALHGGADALARYFEKLELKGLLPEQRLRLAELIALHGGAGALAQHFKKFELEGLLPEQRLKLAELIATHEGAADLAQNFQKFGLGDLPIDLRLRLCRLIASRGGALELTNEFEPFGLNDPSLVKERLELRKLIASSHGGPDHLAFYFFKKLKPDVEEAIALAQTLCRFRGSHYFLIDQSNAVDVIGRQVYLEAWRPPYLGGRDLECPVFTGRVSELLKVLQRDENLPLQVALSTLKGFVEKQPKLSVLIPFIEQIEKTKAEHQPALLDWVAYTAGVLYDQKEKEVSAIESSGMIKFLFEHKKPEDRYIFMRPLSTMAKKGVPLPKVERLPANQYFKVFSPLLLHPLKQLGLDDDTYQALNEEIAKKDFRQFKNFDPVIQFFQCITIQAPLDEMEISFLAQKALEWLKSMPDGPLKTTTHRIRFKDGLHNFTALTSIFNIFKKAEYSDLVTGRREDYANFFAEGFKDNFEIGDLEDLNRKYHETFGTSRDPMALFTYLGAVEKLDKGDKKLVKGALTKYVVAVLEGKFPAVRYEYDQTAESHLKQVFQKPEIREGWIAKSDPIKFSLKAGEEPKAMDYKQFFHTKILDDKHIHPAEVPRLAAFLNGEKTKELSDSEEPLEKLQDLAIQLIKGEIEVGDFLKAVDEFKQDLPEVFRNDLPALTPQKGGGEYQIEESDDPYDLLLMGTEIKGSCQRIDGEPGINKCLVSYLMNGEIKAIAVKKGNKLVARSVMRLLWDPAKGPIILLERVYSNISDKQIDAQILAWAKNKAEQLNVPLVSREVGEQSTPYTGEVNFLGGGIAPFVYSDAGGGVKNGPFNIAESYLQFLPETR